MVMRLPWFAKGEYPGDIIYVWPGRIKTTASSASSLDISSPMWLELAQMATDLKKNQVLENNQVSIPKHPNWGGKRPGGGRMKGGRNTLKPAIREAQDKAIANVLDEFKARLESRLLKNVDNLGQLADGYTKDQAQDIAILPDRQANTYLIDRLLGKPADPNATKSPAPVTNNTLILAGYSIAELEAMLVAMRSLQVPHPDEIGGTRRERND